MYNRTYIYITLFLLLLSSCISRPDYVLDEESMIDVLADVHRSEALLELQQVNTSFSNNDEYKKSVMAAVLVKHGVTRAQYDSSLVWYGQNLASLVRVYSKVQKRLDEEIDYWKNIDNDSRSEFAASEAGDSVQLWTIDNYLIFNENRMYSFRFWEIPVDSNYIAGDSIIWSFRVPAVPESHYMVATLSLNYDDEDISTNYKTVVIRRDTSINMSCVYEPGKKFLSTVASLSLLKDSLNVSDCTAFIDSLSMIRKHRHSSE